MAWLFGGGNDPRKEQIDEFEQSFPEAQCKQEDKSLYDLPFQVGTNSFTLRVYLPPKFPEQKPPVLQLLKPLNHPWVNQYNQVTGHAYLTPNGWDAQFKLVNLVREVLNELRTGSSSGARPHMPPIQPPSGIGYGGVSSAQPASVTIPDPVRGAQATQQPPPYQAAAEEQRPSPGFSIPVPPLPDRFPELEAMDLEQLKRLDRDDVARMENIKCMATYRNMIELRESVIEENAKVAQATLDHRDELETLRAETLALQSTLQELKTNFDERAGRQRALDEQRSSNVVVLETLREAAQASEDESDDLQSQFFAGDFSAEDFLKQFMPVRTTYHRRYAALECSSMWQQPGGGAAAVGI